MVRVKRSGKKRAALNAGAAAQGKEAELAAEVQLSCKKLRGATTALLQLQAGAAADRAALTPCPKLREQFDASRDFSAVAKELSTLVKALQQSGNVVAALQSRE